MKELWVELMVGHGITDWRELHDRADVKKNKLKKWSTLIDRLQLHVE